MKQQDFDRLKIILENSGFEMTIESMNQQMIFVKLKDDTILSDMIYENKKRKNLINALKDYRKGTEKSMRILIEAKDNIESIYTKTSKREKSFWPTLVGVILFLSFILICMIYSYTKVFYFGMFGILSALIIYLAFVFHSYINEENGTN